MEEYDVQYFKNRFINVCSLEHTLVNHFRKFFYEKTKKYLTVLTAFSILYKNFPKMDSHTLTGSFKKLSLIFSKTKLT